MKSKITQLLVLFCSIGAYAQVGFGVANPSVSAELEVKSDNKGVLIPRLTLADEFDKETVKKIEGLDYPESLLVYNKGNDVLKAGFYFWSDEKWNAIVSNTSLYGHVKETVKEGNVIISNKGDKHFELTWLDKSKAKEEERTVDLSRIVGTYTANYMPEEEVFLGKFGEEDLMRYAALVDVNDSFRTIKVPKVIKGLIVSATLINVNTNAITRGVIGKKIVGEETVVSIGTVGTIVTNHPAGKYVVILEYVKR